MAYQKLQAGRALTIIPSDTVNIPNISAVAASGTAAAPTGNQLVGVGTTFTKSVSVGDIIYAGTIAANVLAVVNDTTLNTSAGISSGLSYTIYSEANNPSNGCVLYCGGEGTISIVTVGGDTVELTGVAAGQFIPVQVLRVNATVLTGAIATNIVALW
tara:strand:- start:5 stop:478 length:474 start_codon:yes stop_codon:yes gene_type:complete